jgi:hypothetical protein
MLNEHGIASQPKLQTGSVLELKYGGYWPQKHINLCRVVHRTAKYNHLVGLYYFMGPDDYAEGLPEVYDPNIHYLSSKFLKAKKAHPMSSPNNFVLNVRPIRLFNLWKSPVRMRSFYAGGL